MLASTNLNLSELYKLKELSKNTKYLEQYTYNNLSVIENIPSTTSNSTNVDEFNVLNVEKEEKVLLCNIPSPIPPVVDGSSAESIGTASENCDNIDTLPDVLNIVPETDLDLVR